MSRRHTTAAATTGPGPDRFRRVLLGAVTALLVARPLVAGEDPGRLRALESTSGQTLNLLWLVLALAAAIWLTRSPRRLRFGPVMIGLTLVGLMAALGTGVVACYRHPAWLIVSEMLVLPIILLLVREVTADEDPAVDSSGGVLAAMIASVVSLAAYAGFQALAPVAGWSIPDLPFAADAGPVTSADFFGWSELATVATSVRGTFERADTFAALVILFLPLIIGYALCNQGWRAKVVGLLLPLLAALLLLALRGYVHGDFAGYRVRLGIAADLLSQRPLLGVAPGNFGHHAPRFAVGMNPESLQAPADSWVSLAALSGMPAALLLAGTLIYTIRVMVRSATASGTPALTTRAAPRWEFYLGGVGGLLLGLALRGNDLPISESPRALLHAGVAAGGRALVWFLAFALFEGMAWRGPARRWALAVGLIACAGFGFVSPALLQPAVTQLFWALAGLALVCPVAPIAKDGRDFRWLAIPAACGLAGAYFLLIWDPTFQGAAQLRDARRAGRLYASRIFEYRSLPPPEQSRRVKDYRQFVENMILRPLSGAVASDQTNVALLIELAQWERQYWNDLHADGVLERQALEHSLAARELDRQGVDSLLTELHLRLTFTRLRQKYGSQTLNPKQEEEVQRRMGEHFAAAEELISAIAKQAPALESRMRLRLAVALVNAKNEQRTKQAQAEALRILELEAAPNLPWKLQPAQLAQVRKWANVPAPD